MFWYLLKRMHKFQEPIRLLTYGKIKRLFWKIGFIYENYSMKIINNPRKYAMESRLKINLPDIMAFMSPTMVFVLRKDKEE